mmetsp:Transcript_6419/g.11168  ORF Transcript_6419/g.11168 Transcript_6419/m.11168 type:complete len:214 (+) Transcript_6419:87-728(+)
MIGICQKEEHPKQLPVGAPADNFVYDSAVGTPSPDGQFVQSLYFLMRFSRVTAPIRNNHNILFPSPSSLPIETLSLAHNNHLGLNLRGMIRIKQILDTDITIPPSCLATPTPLVQSQHLIPLLLHYQKLLFHPLQLFILLCPIVLMLFESGVILDLLLIPGNFLGHTLVHLQGNKFNVDILLDGFHRLGIGHQLECRAAECPRGPQLDNVLII